jgi:hypothetical protein
MGPAGSATTIADEKASYWQLIRTTTDNLHQVTGENARTSATQAVKVIEHLQTAGSESRETTASTRLLNPFFGNVAVPPGPVPQEVYGLRYLSTFSSSAGLFDLDVGSSSLQMDLDQPWNSPNE